MLNVLDDEDACAWCAYSLQVNPKWTGIVRKALYSNYFRKVYHSIELKCKNNSSNSNSHRKNICIFVCTYERKWHTYYTFIYSVFDYGEHSAQLCAAYCTHSKFRAENSMRIPHLKRKTFRYRVKAYENHKMTYHIIKLHDETKCQTKRNESS